MKSTDFCSMSFSSGLIFSSWLDWGYAFSAKNFKWCTSLGGYIISVYQVVSELLTHRLMRNKFTNHSTVPECFLRADLDTYATSDPLRPFWVHFLLISYLKLSLEFPERATPCLQAHTAPGIIWFLSIFTWDHRLKCRVQWFVAEIILCSQKS